MWKECGILVHKQLLCLTHLSSVLCGFAKVCMVFSLVRSGKIDGGVLPLVGDMLCFFEGS